ANDPDLLRPGHYGLCEQLQRKPLGSVQLLNNPARMLSHLSQCLFAVKMLAAGDEPKFRGFKIFHAGGRILARKRAPLSLIMCRRANLSPSGPMLANQRGSKVFPSSFRQRVAASTSCHSMGARQRLRTQIARLQLECLKPGMRILDIKKA